MIAQHLDQLDSSVTKLAKELLGNRSDLYALSIAQDRPESLLAQGDLIIIRPCEQVADGSTAVPCGYVPPCAEDAQDSVPSVLGPEDPGQD